MITRYCVICGKPFRCYPSANTVTCSKLCRSERQRRLLLASPIMWGDEAKKRKSQLGQTANLQLGTAAAQMSPIAGRFETNREAKIWILIDPSGNEITVRNLKLWARDHADLFGKPLGDKSANQIAAGFCAIAQTLRGKRGSPGKPSGAMTYFGWTLKCPPESPPDTDPPE